MLNKCPDTNKSVLAKRKFVLKQTQQAESTGLVTLRNQGEIRTGTIPVWVAFRCLYCREYFNRPMAEEHFGTTREDYFKNKTKQMKKHRLKKKKTIRQSK